MHHTAKSKRLLCLCALRVSAAKHTSEDTQTTKKITTVRMSNTRPVIPSAFSPAVEVELPNVSISGLQDANMFGVFSLVIDPRMCCLQH